ncbi:MAG: FHA domain-containing protein [Lachnospiraceae bacterium]|nr:FHA domain-containing protein [Lachnospiraceae bacterium]
MKELKIKKQGQITIIENSLESFEMINQTWLNVVTRKGYGCFLPINIENGRKKNIIRSEINGLINVGDLFRMTVSKNEFLDFMLQLIRIIRLCDSMNLNPANLELTLDTVFLHPVSKEVFVIYWPIVNNERSNPVHVFFKSITKNIDFDMFQKRTFADEYASFFAGHSSFDLDEFENMILTMKGVKTENTTATLRQLSEISYDNKRENKKNVVEPGYLKNRMYDPFSTSSMGEQSKLILTNSKTGRSMVFENDVITIGSDSGNSMSITNIYISRTHAKIILIDGFFYLKDCNSHNGTKLNGEKISSEKMYQLNNGDSIIFANEEYTVSF